MFIPSRFTNDHRLGATPELNSEESLSREKFSVEFRRFSQMKLLKIAKMLRNAQLHFMLGIAIPLVLETTIELTL